MRRGEINRKKGGRKRGKEERRKVRVGKGNERLRVRSVIQLFLLEIN